MKFFRSSEPQPEPVDETEADRAPEPEPALRQVEPGDLAFGRVMASLDLPPGPERDERAAVSARGMERSDQWRTHEYWVLDGLDGAPVGAMRLTRAAEDPESLQAWGAVDPVVRRFGAGERLFAHAVERARELGATTLTSFAMHPSGHAFLVDHGFVSTQTLVVGVAPVAALASLPAEVDGYRIEVAVDELPEAFVAARTVAQRAFAAEVPAGSRDVRQEWDADRVRAWFADRREGSHMVSAMAFAGHELAGFSDVIVDEGRAQASQRDTFVLPDHRRHGLALALKAATAKVVAERFGFVETVRTFVDAGNAGMLAANERAGFAETAHHVEGALDLRQA